MPMLLLIQAHLYHTKSMEMGKLELTCPQRERIINYLNGRYIGIYDHISTNSVLWLQYYDFLFVSNIVMECIILNEVKIILINLVSVGGHVVDMWMIYRYHATSHSIGWVIYFAF